MEKMTRRSFLTGAVAVGALATGGVLTGCAPSSTSGSKEPSDLAATGTPNEASGTAEVTALPQTQNFDIYLPEAGEIAFEEEKVTDVSSIVECDVVICGAGIAGVSAASSCAENGLKTILLEKGDIVAARGGDVACIGDSYHRAANVNLDPEQIISELMLSSGYRADSSLVRTWAYRCGEATDWMLDIVGPDAGEGIIKYKDGNEDCGGVVWYATQIEFAKGMGPIVEGLAAYAEQKGAEVLFKTPAVQLVQSDDGSVSGVIAKTADGDYIQYNAAKGVILATGSYEFNPDKLQACCRPRDLVTRHWMNPTTTDTGDGHLMGLAVGGVEDEYPHTIMTDPSGNGFGTYGPKIGMKPFLRVNSSGLRYVNEHIPSDCLSNAINSQLGAHDFVIADSDIAGAMAQMSDVHDFAGTTPEDAEEEAKAQCISADTLEELAEKLGLPAEALVTTVERYNGFCDAGIDEDFGKNPKYLVPVRKAPFYGFDEATMSLVTVSGLRVDPRCGVLSGETQEAIPGLFAIGNVQGSMFENFYPHHVNGVSHSRCITFGYLLGRQLAGVE